MSEANALMSERKEYEPRPDDIFIQPIPPEREQFIKKVQSAFVNKLVSLAFADDTLIFDFAIFEMIQGSNLRITVTSSQFYIKTLTEDRVPDGFSKFISRTRPIALDNERNLSADLMRRSIIEVCRGGKPLIEFINMRTDERLHPKLKTLITKTMRYAVGIPIFMRRQPIGVLWGIRRKPLTEERKKEVTSQMHSLAHGIEIILSEEMDGDRDAYFARRKIDKIDTYATVQNVLYTRVPGQDVPVKSQISYSYRYNTRFRQDTSFIIPTSNGFAISLKRFLPENINDRKMNILMIPGFFCNRSLLDRLAREMALKYGYRVFTLDMRGRSKYTLPKRGLQRLVWSVDDYIWEDFPAAIRWIQEHHPQDRIAVMGHSMGGMIPQFYASSYENCRTLCRRHDLIDVDGLLAGIVSITSPSYINLAFNNPWIEMLSEGVRIMSNTSLMQPAFKIFSLTMENALGTVDLNRFFKFLHNISSSIRAMSFDVGRWPTIKDFIGYPEITPPEWYYFMEDVFCEESVRVIMQFLRSQNHGGAFKSFDGRLNYTMAQEKLKIPLMSVVGTLDTLAPPETVMHTQQLARSPKNKVIEFEQGHLGIITHLPTVRKIAAAAHDWFAEI